MKIESGVVRPNLSTSTRNIILSIFVLLIFVTLCISVVCISIFPKSHIRRRMTELEPRQQGELATLKNYDEHHSDLYTLSYSFSESDLYSISSDKFDIKRPKQDDDGEKWFNTDPDKPDQPQQRPRRLKLFNVETNTYCCPEPEKKAEDYDRRSSIDRGNIEEFFKDCRMVIEGAKLHMLGESEEELLFRLSQSFGITKSTVLTREGQERQVELCKQNEVLDYDLYEIREMLRTFECVGRCSPRDLDEFFEEHSSYVEYVMSVFDEEIIHFLRDSLRKSDETIRKEIQAYHNELVSEDEKFEYVKSVLYEVESLAQRDICEGSIIRKIEEQEDVEESYDEVDVRFNKFLLDVCEKEIGPRDHKMVHFWNKFCTAPDHDGVCVRAKLDNRIVDQGKMLAFLNREGEGGGWFGKPENAL